MITAESMISIGKDDLPEASKNLGEEDIPQLVAWLSLKEDEIRYPAFLLLKNRSALFDDVYPFWDVFKDKLKSDNSFQRNIGLILIAENARWDKENKTEDIIDGYLELINDEKPITVRQCIQSLGKIAACRPELSGKITRALISVNLMDIKETMRKSILLDILNVLIITGKEYKSDETESFILSALSGDILDKKAKKQIEALL